MSQASVPRIVVANPHLRRPPTTSQQAVVRVVNNGVAAANNNNNGISAAVNNNNDNGIAAAANDNNALVVEAGAAVAMPTQWQQKKKKKPRCSKKQTQFILETRSKIDAGVCNQFLINWRDIWVGSGAVAGGPEGARFHDSAVASKTTLWGRIQICLFLNVFHSWFVFDFFVVALLLGVSAGLKAEQWLEA